MEYKKNETKQQLMVLPWPTKIRKESKAPNSTQRHSRQQRLGPAPQRALWVRAGVRQGGCGSSLNLRDASSTTVLGFPLPLQEMRVRDAWLILVTIYFFPLREYYITIQSHCVCVFKTCSTLVIAFCSGFCGDSETSGYSSWSHFVAFSATSSKPSSRCSYLDWWTGSDPCFRNMMSGAIWGEGPQGPELTPAQKPP